QAGSLPEVYARPASPEVARLLGIQNLQHGTVSDAGHIEAAGMRIAVVPHDLVPGSPVLWCIRPEGIRLDPDGRYPAKVVDVVEMGAVADLVIHLGGGPELRVRGGELAGVSAGMAVNADLPIDAISVWPADGAITLDEVAAGTAAKGVRMSGGD
ncbi:MAG TPA: TOBE domain-containing protein, partial [Actinomycetota bacterium]|nr:TOBE domain-containing protein [Actinomycetota bacterium]